MDISQRITAIRKEMKLSQEKFGELVGMSQRSVAAWESGDRLPSFPVLSDLADKLGVTVDYLLGRTEDRGQAKSAEKKQPTVSDDGLKDQIIAQIRTLPDPALSRVADFLSGLQAGRESAAAEAAAPDPDGAPSP